MKKRFVKKLLISAAAACALFAAMTISAFACTTIYVGGDLTEEGAPIVARSEDYVNSQNKLFYISEAGEYKAGTVYHGCDYYGGFEWKMNHDSYRFTAFTADILHDGKCPECGKAGHPSYTESGTNEKGVTVSATETLSGKPEILGSSTDGITGVDPYCRTKTADGKVGIEETDIPTVILSEAASAREGVELLLKIYDEYGCYGGSGLFIADQKEIWYVENCSGTQYLALKLNDKLMFLEPNMSTIGRIDLDDTENVIASDRLIEVAKEAGTFVGEEENNIIDYRASYNRSNTVNARMVNGLNFVNKAYGYTDEALIADNTKFCISNLDADGKIVDLYTNIRADRKMTVDDIVNYYKVDGISNTGNTDTAFFQIFSDRPANTGTVEWVSLDTGAFNVFVPYYPMLLNETYAGFRAAVGEADKVKEKPDSGMYYKTTNRNGDSYYVAFPKDWETSYYWCFDALNNYIAYAKDTTGSEVSGKDKAYALTKLKALQQEIYDEFGNISLEGLTEDAAKKVTTEKSNAMAQKAHQLALELVNYLRNAPAETDMPFTDVKEGSWFYDAVAYVYEKGMMNGTSNTSFAPEGSTTRGMIVTILWRLEDQPSADIAAAFSDVKAGSYYEKAVAWAAENNIVNGYSAAKFGPNDNITREQMAAILYRYAQLKKIDVSAGENTDLSSYTDAASISSYAVPSFKWACASEIIQGSGGKLTPSGDATRAQVAAIFKRFCEKTA